MSSGFKVEANFDSIQVKEAPPVVVVETARVLARRDELSYNLPLEEQGDYFVILYFGGILAVHPSFDVLMNGKVIESNYTVEMGEMRALYVIQEQIKSLIITFKSVKFYPQVNAIEVYQIVHVPLEASSTTGVMFMFRVYPVLSGLMSLIRLRKLGALQLVSEPDTGWCVSEDAGLPRGVDCEIPCRLERGAKHSL